VLRLLRQGSIELGVAKTVARATAHLDEVACTNVETALLDRRPRPGLARWRHSVHKPCGLCRRHHRTKQQRRWSFSMTSNGEVHLDLAHRGEAQNVPTRHGA
jgi:hypothetical protein